MSGCVKAIIILLVLFVIAVVAFFVFAGVLINNLARNLGIDPNGGGGGSGMADCSFLSDADARAVFGGNADAIELSGLAEATIGIIIDQRVLPNAPDCWVTDGQKAYIARIARYQGADAASVFAAEHKAAEPTSKDQGGGVTLENPGYLGEAVSGLGDEAFCTDISAAIMAGVLVRQGDRVVYVSVGSADAEQPTIDGSTLCSFAQEVARVVLR
jgi:hypothetical protein